MTNKKMNRIARIEQTIIDFRETKLTGKDMIDYNLIMLETINKIDGICKGEE